MKRMIAITQFAVSDAAKAVVAVVVDDVVVGVFVVVVGFGAKELLQDLAIVSAAAKNANLLFP